MEWFIANALFGANVNVGAKGRGGNISVRHSDGTPIFRVADIDASLQVGADGHPGQVTILGGKGPSVNQSGKLIVQDNRGIDVFQVTGSELRLGGKGKAGRLSIEDGSDSSSLTFDGSFLRLGNKRSGGHVIVRDPNGGEALQFDGRAATILWERKGTQERSVF